MSVSVLMTCAGGNMMPALFLSLRQDSVLSARVVGVDVNSDAKGRHYADAFHVVPWATEAAYVECLASIARAERVDVILPGSDQEAFCLAGAREAFDSIGVKVLASPTEVLDLIRDKSATYAALKAAGIRVPEYACVGNAEDLAYALHSFGYPERDVIVKPVAGRGGRGMRLLVGKSLAPAAWIGSGAREQRFETQVEATDLQGWFDDGALMVMPLMNAPAYDVDVFAHRGRAKAALVRRRFNPAGIPFTGNRIVSDPVVMRYCLDIAEALGLDALHDIDLLTDDQGHPCLLEVNPRPSGSVVAAHAAGFPIVAAAVAETLGISYPINAPERDIDVGMIPAAMTMVIPAELP